MPTLSSSMGGSNFSKAKVDCSKPQESSKVDQHPLQDTHVHACMHARARTHIHTHTHTHTGRQAPKNRKLTTLTGQGLSQKGSFPED